MKISTPNSRNHEPSRSYGASGDPTEETSQHLGRILDKDDIIIDGGNTKFHNDVRRASDLQKQNIHYVDAGTSEGIGELQIGYCLMVGGEKGPITHLGPILTTLTPENGWAHVDGYGAGHYVKMVHNGIEDSMMQGYAEGFELTSKSDYNLDLGNIADLWMYGSVARSWLLKLAAGALKNDPKLEGLKGYIQDSGEGRWMLMNVLDKDVPVPTLSTALFDYRSRQEESFSEKMLAALAGIVSNGDCLLTE